MFHADDVPQGHRKGGMFYYFLNTDRTIMNNPYNIQATPIMEIIEKQLSYGLENTADMLLEYMKVNAKVDNFINWLMLKFPAKEEMIRIGLFY